MLLRLTVTWHIVLWGFLGNYLISHQKFRASAPTADMYLLCDGEDGSDSAGTGGVSIPNYLRHPASDLLIEGSFLLGIFRETAEILFASTTGLEY